MLISELSFPHLREAQDARLEQQLERRRVALERLGEQGARRTRRGAARAAHVASGERMPRAGLEAGGSRAAEACPA